MPKRAAMSISKATATNYIPDGADGRQGHQLVHGSHHFGITRVSRMITLYRPVPLGDSQAR
jgi:hypothetical protein